MRVTKDFYLTEFVSKNIYDQFGDKSIWFVDFRLIMLAQFVRDFFDKPITINNWWDDKDVAQVVLSDERQYSGFREPACTIGGKLSQHRYGRAIDIKVAGMTPQEVYKAILKAETNFIDAGLTTMEDIRDTPTWNHLDIRHTELNKILIVRP